MHSHNAIDMLTHDSKGGAIIIPLNPPESSILITGNEEPGSVYVTVLEPGVRDDVSAALPGKDTIDPDFGSGWGEYLSTQVSEQGYIRCAHDGWHNLIAFSGLSTLLLVILLGLILTRRK